MLVTHLAQSATGKQGGLSPGKPGKVREFQNG